MSAETPYPCWDISLNVRRHKTISFRQTTVSMISRLTAVLDQTSPSADWQICHLCKIAAVSVADWQHSKSEKSTEIWKQITLRWRDSCWLPLNSCIQTKCTWRSDSTNLFYNFHTWNSGGRQKFKTVNQNKWKSSGVGPVSSPAKPRQPSPALRIPTAAFCAIDDVHTQLVGPKLTFAHSDRVAAKANFFAETRRCCYHLVKTLLSDIYLYILTNYVRRIMMLNSKWYLTFDIQKWNSIHLNKIPVLKV